MSDLPERYQRRRVLGRGGMGEVLLVFDQQRGEEVALKRLAPAPGADVEEARLLFAREYWTMASLPHPHLVAAHDFGGDHFTMAYVPGTDLDQALTAQTEAQVRAWLPGLLDALGALHAAGWVHGDLKPANLRLRADGHVTLMDLGLLRPAGAPAGPIRGSLLYLAPEAIAAGALDARTDLYALGAVLYHLLAGRPPFAASLGGRAGWALPLLRAHLTQPPPPLRTAGVSPELAGLIMRLLAKDPAQRPAGVAEVLAVLGQAGTPPAPGLLAPPLVGREAARAELDAFLAGPVGRVWTVVGPAGSGKTRLLAETRARLQLAGEAPYGLIGSDGPAYDAWQEPLTALLAAAPGAARERAAQVLARLWPLPGVVPAPPLEAQQERARLHLAVAELLEAAAPGAAWLVDDADRLDPASAELLDFLRPLGRWVLARTGEGGLPPVDGKAVARAMLGQERLPAPLARLVAGPRQPGDVEGLLRAAVREGALVAGPSGWNVPRGRTLSGRPDAGVSALARDVARTAGLLGAHADLVAVQGVLGLADGPFFAALAESERAELVARDGLLVRPLQVLEAPPSLAGAAGRWLAARGSDPQALVARLLLQGDRPGEAMPWAIAAARRALAVHALDQAEALVRPALAQDPGPADRWQLEGLLAVIHRGRGRLDEALAVYEQLLPALRAAADPGLAAHLVTQGLILQMKGRYPEARAAFEEATSRAAGPEDGARASYAAARLAYFQGDPTAARGLGVRALAQARAAERPALVASVLGFHGYMLANDPATEAEGMALLQEAVALCAAQGDVMQEQVVLDSLGNAQLAAGRPAEALASFEAGRRLCERMRIPNELVFAHLNLGVAQLELGAAREAAAQADRAVALARAQGRQFPEAFALAVGGHARVLGGDATGLAAIAQGLALARTIGNAYAERGILVHQAQALAQLGRGEEATEVAGTARALAEAAGDRAALRKLAGLQPAPARPATGLPAVLERTLTAFVALARAQRGFLLLYDGFAVTHKLAVGAVGPGDDAFSSTLAHRVLWQGAPLWIDDLQQHPALAGAESVQALGLRAVLGVPLEAGGETIGVLLADSTDLEARFDPADLAAAVALGREAAGAIAAARRLAAAEEGLANERRVRKLAMAAAAAPDLEAFWPLLADEALALTGADRALYLAGPALTPVASRGAARGPVVAAIAAWVRETGTPLHLPDAREDGLRTVLAAPVPGHGVLYLELPVDAMADPALLPTLAGLAEVLGALVGRGATTRSGATNL